MALLVSFSFAFLVAAKAEEAKVFGDAFRVEGIGDKAMALCLEGDTLYAGAGAVLYVYDISKPLAPRKLGEVGGLGGVRQIAVQKGMAYVSTREYGLWIVDATRPQARVCVPFDCCELATGVDVAGDVCFLGQRQNGVEFIFLTQTIRATSRCARRTSLKASCIATGGSTRAIGGRDTSPSLTRAT
jgi:hypothetical protein